MYIQNITIEIINNIAEYLDDTSFVYFTFTNKYFNALCNLKKLHNQYNFLDICFSTNKYIFTNILYDHKKLHCNQIYNYITKLTFDDTFNDEVKFLPESIRYLKFGQNFNRPVDNLPNRINYLIPHIRHVVR